VYKHRYNRGDKYPEWRVDPALTFRMSNAVDVTNSYILQKAKQGKYAVGAFNINNLEYLENSRAQTLAIYKKLSVNTSVNAWDESPIEKLIA